MSDTCACSRARHVCCVNALRRCQRVEVDLVSALEPRSGSCSSVSGEALVHVVDMTPCLSGLRAVVSVTSVVSASGLLAVRGMYSNTREPCLSDAKMIMLFIFYGAFKCNLKVYFLSAVSLTFFFFFVFECTTGLSHGGIEE